MANIPLPALGIQAPQQTDILGQAAKLRQFQAMGQEQQLRGQQIQAATQANQLQAQKVKDMQTVTDLYKKNHGDIDKTVQDAANAGVTPETLQGLQQHALLMKTQNVDLLQKQGTLAIQQADLMKGAHDTVAKASQQDRPAVYQQQLMGLQKSGVDVSQMPVQYPGDAQLELLGAAVQGHSKQLEDLAKQAEISKNTAQAGEATAGTGEKQAETELKKAQLGAVQQGGAVPGVSLDVQEANSWLKKNPGKTLADFQKYKATLVPAYNFSIQNAGATGSAGQPSAIAQAIAKGDMKWGDAVSARTPMSVRQALLGEVKQINPNFNSGDFAIEQGVKKDFTSGDAAKNLTAFNTAIEHAQQLQQATDAMGNGDVRTLNKIGNALGYEFGSDKKTNFEVIKNALSGEISKVFKGGQATDAEIREVQGPFNSANSPEQLKGAINGAIKLMNSKRDALKTQYDNGVKAKPNFGGNAPAGTSGAGDFFSNFGGKAKQ